MLYYYSLFSYYCLPTICLLSTGLFVPYPLQECTYCVPYLTSLHCFSCSNTSKKPLLLSVLQGLLLCRHKRSKMRIGGCLWKRSYRNGCWKQVSLFNWQNRTPNKSFSKRRLQARTSEYCPPYQEEASPRIYMRL